MILYYFLGNKNKETELNKVVSKCYGIQIRQVDIGIYKICYRKNGAWTMSGDEYPSIEDARQAAKNMFSPLAKARRNAVTAAKVFSKVINYGMKLRR